MPVNFSVEVRNHNLEMAIHSVKKKFAGMRKEVGRSMYYLSPTERRRLKARNAQRRVKKIKRQRELPRA